jgi:hypothetical protein
MQDVAKLWEARGEPRLRFNFAASSTLARQLEQGAQANLFASADQLWMDWAQSRTLIAPDTRRTLLGNRLVLVTPANSTAQAAATHASSSARAVCSGEKYRLLTREASKPSAPMPIVFASDHFFSDLLDFPRFLERIVITNHRITHSLLWNLHPSHHPSGGICICCGVSVIGGGGFFDCWQFWWRQQMRGV